jgi:hypothetical protein
MEETKKEKMERGEERREKKIYKLIWMDGQDRQSSGGGGCERSARLRSTIYGKDDEWVRKKAKFAACVVV